MGAQRTSQAVRAQDSRPLNSYSVICDRMCSGLSAGSGSSCDWISGPPPFRRACALTTTRILLRCLRPCPRSSFLILCSMGQPRLIYLPYLPALIYLGCASTLSRMHRRFSLSLRPRFLVLRSRTPILPASVSPPQGPTSLPRSLPTSLRYFRTLLVPVAPAPQLVLPPRVALPLLPSISTHGRLSTSRSKPVGALWAHPSRPLPSSLAPPVVCHHQLPCAACSPVACPGPSPIAVTASPVDCVPAPAPCACPSVAPSLVPLTAASHSPSPRILSPAPPPPSSSRDHVPASPFHARPSVAPDPGPPSALVTPPPPRNPSPSAPFRYSSPFGNTPKLRTRHGPSLRTFSHERRAHGTVAGTWAPSFSRPCRGSPTRRSSSSVCLDRVYTVNASSCGMEVMFRSIFGRRAAFTFKVADPVNWHDACRRFLGSLVLIHRIVLPLFPIRTHQARAIIFLRSPGVAFCPTSPIGFGLFFGGPFFFSRLSQHVSLLSFLLFSFPPGEERSSQTMQDHQGNRLTSRCSQRSTIQADSSRSAGAREGPEFVVQMSHWPADVSQLCLVLPKVWPLRFLWDHFVRFLRIPSPALLGLSGCIPFVFWLLVVAMPVSLFGGHGVRARLGGYVRPDLASSTSCFSDFPRDPGLSCFTLMSSWFCFMRSLFVFSGFEALRPTCDVFFMLFQAVLRTPINQDGPTLRIAPLRFLL